MRRLHVMDAFMSCDAGNSAIVIHSSSHFGGTDTSGTVAALLRSGVSAFLVRHHVVGTFSHAILLGHWGTSQRPWGHASNGPGPVPPRKIKRLFHRKHLRKITVAGDAKVGQKTKTGVTRPDMTKSGTPNLSPAADRMSWLRIREAATGLLSRAGSEIGTDLGTQELREGACVSRPE
jgi:hypothetical protein